MTTTICPTETLQSQFATDTVSQHLSDAEILRRVERIKSTWSLAERAERRREADRRFEHLIDVIFAEAA